MALPVYRQVRANPSIVSHSAHAGRRRPAPASNNLSLGQVADGDSVALPRIGPRCRCKVSQPNHPTTNGKLILGNPEREEFYAQYAAVLVPGRRTTHPSFVPEGNGLQNPVPATNSDPGEYSTGGGLGSP